MNWKLLLKLLVELFTASDNENEKRSKKDNK